MRRALKWLRRLVLGALAFAVVALVFVVIALHTDWGRNKLRARVEEALQRTFPGSTIGALRGSVFGTVTLDHVRLVALDGAELATIDSIDVDIELLPLLGKTARIDTLVARGAVIHARAFPLPPDDGKRFTWIVDIPDLQLLAAHVVTSHGAADADLRGAFSWRDETPRAAIAMTATYAGVRYGGLATFDGVARASSVGTGPRPMRDVMERATIAARGGDLFAAVTIEPRDGSVLHAVLSAGQGARRVDGVVLGDPHALAARGVLGVQAPEGRGVIAVAGGLGRAQVTVIGHGAYPGAPPADVVVAADGWLDRFEALILAAGPGEARVAVVGAATAGAELVIERARIGAEVADLAAATGGRANVRGALRAQASASGTLSALDVAATATGDLLVFELPATPTSDAIAENSASATSVRVRVSAKGPLASLAIDASAALSGARFRRVSSSALRVRASSSGPLRGVLAVLTGGRRGDASLARSAAVIAHVETDRLANRGQPIVTGVVDARSRRDGTFGAHVVGRLAMAPITGTVDSTLRIGATTDFALGAYHFDTRAGAWDGTGGHVTIDRADVRVRGVRADHGAAWATVVATIHHASGGLAADLEAHAVPISAIDARVRGTVTGSVSLTRRSRYSAWAGGGTLSAAALGWRTDPRTVDAGATVEVKGRRVSVALSATNAEIGGARVALEVDGPRDVLDGKGWLRVARGDLRGITIGADKVHAPRIGGDFDGTIDIRDGVPAGAIHGEGIATPVGEASGDVTIVVADAQTIDLRVTGGAGPVHDATVTARLKIPEHPFDPAEWRALGPRVVRGATADAKDVRIDPELARELGYRAPYSATAAVHAEVGEGGTAANVVADITGITGGTIVQPIDAHVTGATDATGTRATLHATSGALVLADLPDAKIAMTPRRWLDDHRAVLALPISGTLALGPLDAAPALAVIGRTDVVGGNLRGTLAIGGTVLAPTVDGSLDLANIRVRPQLAVAPPPALTALHADLGWDGSAAHLHVSGREESSGPPADIEIDVRGPDLARARGSVVIHHFDLAPVVAFLPGRLAGAGGLVDADVHATGLEPRGTITISDGRMPISATVGTLRRATAKLTVDDKGITAKLDGKVGAGSVNLTATTDAGGLDTTLDATLAKVAPIGAVQPVIDARLHGTFHRTGLTWAGKATVSGGSIFVPDERGHELLDAAVPDDLMFTDLPVPHLAVAARAPEHPFLVAEVDIQPVRVQVPEYAVDGVGGGHLRVSVGAESFGLDGGLLVERGSADLFGHRYRVELGQVEFDGTTDGVLDLKLAHDFTDMTMYVRFSGRLSDLGRAQPEFSADPGLYSQGQLLGFFLGGEPGGDPTKQAQEAVTGFGAAVASSTIGKRFERYFPIKFEVLRCDPAAGTTSASCSAGKWLTPRVFFTTKYRIAPRLDENTLEGTAEWHFRPSWELDFSGGDANYDGADVLWRHRW